MTITKEDVSIVFKDEFGYFVLQGESPERTRVNIVPEEVYINFDIKISDNEPPLLQCDEEFANAFMDRLEKEQLEKIERTCEGLVSKGDLRVEGVSPDGSNLYGLTLKGASRKPITKLNDLLTNANRHRRDFTPKE